MIESLYNAKLCKINNILDTKKNEDINDDPMQVSDEDLDYVPPTEKKQKLEKDLLT